MPRRVSEASICSMIALRDRPDPPGPWCILKCTLVAKDDVLPAALLLDGSTDDFL